MPMLTLQDVLDYLNKTWDDFQSKPAGTANDKGSFEDYPLHKFALSGDVDAARILLENGADINAIGEDGDTPLHRAVSSKQVTMINFLLAHGANPKICNRYGIAASDN